MKMLTEAELAQLLREAWTTGFNTGASGSGKFLTAGQKESTRETVVQNIIAERT